MSVGSRYAGLGFVIIIYVCTYLCRSSKRINLSYFSLSGLCALVLVIYTSFSALIRSTVDFASLEKQIIRSETWMDVQQCLYHDSQVCSQFRRKYANDTEHQFFTRHLTLLESGCCNPPTECNFSFSSATVWIKLANATVFSNADCNEWNNDPKRLCYNCQVCNKLGLAQDVKRAWIVSAPIIIIASLVLVSGFTIAINLDIWASEYMYERI